MSQGRDLKLIGTALNEKWPISPTNRSKVINTLMEIIDSPDKDQASRAAAILAKLDMINVHDERNKILAQPKHHVHTNLSTEELLIKIQERLKELGMENVQPSLGVGRATDRTLEASSP